MRYGEQDNFNSKITTRLLYLSGFALFEWNQSLWTVPD